jgi:hypothetical protein
MKKMIVKGRKKWRKHETKRIIITGKTDLLEPQPSLENSARFDPVFTCLDFVTILFTEQGRQPCVQLPTWWAMYLYLCPSVARWSSYIPRHGVPFSSLL